MSLLYCYSLLYSSCHGQGWPDNPCLIWGIRDPQGSGGGGWAVLYNRAYQNQ